MIFDFLSVLVATLAGIAVAAVLVLGFAYLIFLADADARGKALVSTGFDRFAAFVIYVSWFGLLWWFGFSLAILTVACAATVVLCMIYAASYAASKQRQHATQTEG